MCSVVFSHPVYFVLSMAHVSVSHITGVAIDGNNNEDKERFIKLVKKRGKVKALEEELYSKCL